MPYQATILGAGAAGLFCAGLLAQRGLRVLLLDHAPEPGRKILISGGGRANFTHLHTTPAHFLSANPHFSKSALAGYSPQQFVALVERYGIAYHAKTPGQLFCDGSARQLVTMLLAEAAAAELRLLTELASAQNTAEGFILTLRDLSTGTLATVLTQTLILATGGLSIPKLGATGLGYQLAQQFGLPLQPTRPALVPLTFQPHDADRFEGLSGLAIEAALRLAPHPARSGKRPQPIHFQDKLLITHRGLSGPAVLQLSSYWEPGQAVTIDLAPGRRLTDPLLTPHARRDPAAYREALAAHLPRRLAERLQTLAPPTAYTNEALQAAEHELHHWPLTPAGTEGYAKAEVTAGGISTEALHAHSLQAKAVPGLYCIGELVDVTGHLGGHNFQWAWASAYAAAQAIAGAL